MREEQWQGAGAFQYEGVVQGEQRRMNEADEGFVVPDEEDFCRQ
jgi:hypothetical protein